MTMLTLLRDHNPLADARTQVELLERVGTRRFAELLADHKLPPLRAETVNVLQLNLGKLCNQTCAHCHVDAGPDRREIMSRATVEDCLRVLAQSEIPVVDVTGGAPEMNPHFRWLVDETRKLGRQVIDRCNLTILLARGFEDLPEFLAAREVEVVASLPCYLPENTDRQRGPGVFAKSIEAIRRLNALGYGQCKSRRLTLVYNPVGPSLPPSQEQLEAEYRRQLWDQHRLHFTRLFTITNMPISRFLDDLLRTGHYESYMAKLIEAFNPIAADRVMCRGMISVGWDGRLYDCDFNQMLELALAPDQPQHIRDFDLSRLRQRNIVIGQHCFGCTAGCGSSCQGAAVSNLNCLGSP